MLRDTAHNGFPVVKDSPSGQVFLGLITRPHLMVLLQRFISAQGSFSGGGGGMANGVDLRWGRSSRVQGLGMREEVSGMVGAGSRVACHMSAKRGLWTTSA